VRLTGPTSSPKEGERRHYKLEEKEERKEGGREKEVGSSRSHALIRY
jgi:hypothetical protein